MCYYNVMKKSLLVIVLFLCLILLSGCSQISYSFVDNDSLGYEENYSFSLNSQTLMDEGITSSQIVLLKNRVTTLLTNKANSLKDDFALKVQLASNLTTEQKNAYILSFNTQFTEENGLYKFSLLFANRETYKYYYDIVDDDDEELDIRYNFLTYRIYQKGVTQFGKKVKIDENTEMFFGDYLWETAKTNMRDIIGNKVDDLDNPTFEYCYVTTNNRLHSNSDLTYKYFGYTYHIWNVDSEDMGREIEFYVQEARREIWYSLILGATVVFMAIYYFSAKILDKKNQKNN